LKSSELRRADLTVGIILLVAPHGRSVFSLRGLQTVQTTLNGGQPGEERALAGALAPPAATDTAELSCSSARLNSLEVLTLWMCCES
jgi:hypothetical protein